MRPDNCPRTSKRVVRKYITNLFTQEPRQSLREIYDSMVKGTSINSPIRRHEPLLPDGMDEDDFDIGTREVLDLVDQQKLEEDVAAVKQAILEKQEAYVKAKSDADFEAKVEAEVAKRVAKSDIQG